MKSATTMKPTAHSAAVEPTADARLSTGRKAPRRAAMIEPAESAGTSAGLEVRRLRSVELRATVGPRAAMKVRATVESRAAMEVRATVESRAAMKARAIVESWAAAVEVVAIGEGAAVRDVSVVVEVHSPVAPIGVPVVPPPTESAEEADPPTESERNPRADGPEAGVPVPAWVSDQRRTIDRPRVVFGHVDDLGVCRLDHDRLALRGDVFLGRTLEVSSLLRSLAHDLDGVEHRLLLVHVCVAQRRRPGEVLVHACQHGGKLRDRLDARIPGLLIDRLGELLPLQIGVLLHPTVSFHDFGRVGGGGKDLRNQGVRIQRDGRHQLLQLLGSFLDNRLSLHRGGWLGSC